jgi:predicted amino acid racemase
VTFPSLIVDLEKVRENTQRAVKAAANIAIFGVTKGCAASLPVARAMLDGGVAGLADSRLGQLEKLRGAFPETPLLAQRQPMRDEMHPLLNLDATIMISDLDSARALNEEARRLKRRQAVVLMIEAGDGREGIQPQSLGMFIRAVDSLPGLRPTGLAINAGCRGGKVPDERLMEVFDKAVRKIRGMGFSLDMISAGNSSCWRLLENNRLPDTVTHLRLGEIILLGRETAGGEIVPGFHPDAFIVRAEVLESSDKLGGRRLVCALGCQDTGAGELTPVDPRLRVDRLTSDHTVLKAAAGFRAGSGDYIDFIPSYFALQSLAASSYVCMTYISYNEKRSNCSETDSSGKIVKDMEGIC